jgi:hypothetical protein
MRERNFKGTSLHADAVTLPGSHHQPVRAQGNLERVMIARPMMDVDFQECMILGESDLRRSIQSLGHIDRIADGNNIPIDLVGPDVE